MASGGRNAERLHLDALEPLRRPTGNGWRHIGLGSLLARFDAMGGAMDIDSASSGTTVTVTSPPEPATSSSALER